MLSRLSLGAKYLEKPWDGHVPSTWTPWEVGVRHSPSHEGPGLEPAHWLPGNLKRAGGGIQPFLSACPPHHRLFLICPMDQTLNSPLCVARLRPPPALPSEVHTCSVPLHCCQEISFSPTASLSSPSRIHSRCSLVLSFSFFRGIVIGCALIRISLRRLQLSSTPRNLQTPF